MSVLYNILKKTYILLFLLILLVSGLWCAGIIYFSEIPDEKLRYAMALAYPFFWIPLAVFMKKRWSIMAWYGLCSALIITVWLFIPPSHDRDWLAEYARLPHAEYIDENTVSIHDVRDFDYHVSRENFTERYQDILYDLNDLEGVDMVITHWDDQVLIAHFQIIFRFNNAENLVISAETRREKGEPWDIPRGFFNQYELIYILGTETDLIKRRTNVSKQDVFLYPTTLDKEAAQELFRKALQVVNTLYQQPEFYNTLELNCTSALFPIARDPSQFHWYTPELLLNGFADRFFYRRGALEGTGSYWNFKTSHYITPIAQAAGDDGDFSKAIRK